MIAGLKLWEDREPRTASEHMAVDEALLPGEGFPVVRFYRWATPAATFGYGQRYAEVLAVTGDLPAIRRWTGGGIVFHGEDLTIALAVPGSHPVSRMPSGLFYERIHAALLNAVHAVFPRARLATAADCYPGPACFESPASNDIIHGRRKICGGALRRGKHGILYQGSLQGGTWDGFSLAASLCEAVAPFEPGQELLQRAGILERERYGTPGWNKKR
jgi:lipoate-protein ligase A